MQPRYRAFQVTGIFRSGFYQYDSSYGFVSLVDAQRLFSEPDLISAINFKIDDMYNAAEVGREIEDAAGPGFQYHQLDGAEPRVVPRAAAGTGV